MIRLLQFIIFGHWHHWKTIRESDYREKIDGPSVGRVYYQQCEGCGKVVRRDLH